MVTPQVKEGVVKSRGERRTDEDVLIGAIGAQAFAGGLGRCDRLTRLSVG